MLQSLLYVVGMIALPLAVEAALAPRPCLWLLRGALSPSRRHEAMTRQGFSESENSMVPRPKRAGPSSSE